MEQLVEYVGRRQWQPEGDREVSELVCDGHSEWTDYGHEARQAPDLSPCSLVDSESCVDRGLCDDGVGYECVERPFVPFSQQGWEEEEAQRGRGYGAARGDQVLAHSAQY